MKKIFYKGRFIFIPVLAFAFLSLISYVVMQLWNHLLPEILGVSSITFWQAAGIFLLCKILFGFGKGSRMGPPWMKGDMRERFGNMSSEEKEAFKTRMKERMCWGGRERTTEHNEKEKHTDSHI